MNEISDETKTKLSGLFYIISKNSFLQIDIFNEGNVSIYIPRFQGSNSLDYYTVAKPIIEIKRENYTENAWYVDENGAIIESKL